ncbi:hypothetical protein EU245_02290 [Lentibacillus lipolyticus]|nr:hypothetical protein EU245_02290 [Lentibacillus lipolyticus]
MEHTVRNQHDNNHWDEDRRTEEDMFKAFYQDYQEARQELFEHLQIHNSEWDTFVLLKQSQKILNRIVVVCFCEGSGLLPANGFQHIVQAAKQSLDGTGIIAWDQLKILFDSMNKEYFSLGGSLFHKDPVLERLTIRNNMFLHFEKIANYPLSAELYANLPGYVFEQSINDLEEAKRKKNGIFYTSPSVTRLLLEETLLRWIDDRKEELPAANEKFFYHTLKERLKSIRILDPAAGSGAFLTMAFAMLVKETEEINKKLGWNMESDSGSYSILNNNLFGVDLNKESVDICKLSLCLQTAGKIKKRPPLEDNVKSGDSIVDNPAISDQAFDWHTEFPEIMDEGGFDVIIGNPPYVFARGSGFTEAEKTYFRTHYQLADYQINTYLLFIERSYELLKDGGWFAFIVPNTCLTIDSFKKMRRFLLEHTGNLKIINIHDRIFEQADVDTCLIIFQKTGPTTVKLGEYVNNEVAIVAEVQPEELLDNDSIINVSLMKNQHALDIMKKMEEASQPLSNIASIKSGLVAYEIGRGKPPQTKKMKANRVYHCNYQVDETYWKYLEGRDVCRYSINWRGSWLQYGPNLAARRKENIFTSPRILVRQIPSKSTYAIHAVYTEEEILNDRNSNNIINFQKDPMFLLGVINSKVMTFWFIHKFDKFQRKTFPQLKVKDLKRFPVPDVTEQEQKRISEAVKQMLQVQCEKSKLLQALRHEPYSENRIGSLIEQEQELDNQIDQLTAAAFGLNNEEQRLIDANLAAFLK